MALPSGTMIVAGSCSHGSRQLPTKSSHTTATAFEDVLELSGEGSAGDLAVVSDLPSGDSDPQCTGPQIPGGMGLFSFMTVTSQFQDSPQEQGATGEMKADEQRVQGEGGTVAGGTSVTDIDVQVASRIGENKGGLAKEFQTEGVRLDVRVHSEDLEGDDSLPENHPTVGESGCDEADRLDHTTPEAELPQPENQFRSTVTSSPEIVPIQMTTASQPPARQILVQIESLIRGTRVSPELLQKGTDIRSLRLTLKPELLGEVEVMMRRSGGEMHVRIVVSTDQTARMLEGDMSLLRERIDQLMQTEGSPAVLIQVLSSGESLSPPAAQHGAGDGSAPASLGNSPAGSGERQAPRKRDAGTRQASNEPQDRNPSLQPGISHIVV